MNLATFGPFEEGLYFGAGSSGTLMEVEGRKIGVVICYDLFFPELAKSYALAGAETVICISASPITSRDFFERLIPARAIENTAYVGLCQPGRVPAEPGVLRGRRGLRPERAIGWSRTSTSRRTLM